MPVTLSPVDYGLPARYSSWRTGQLEAIDQIYLSPARFSVLCAPTGFGKSLVAMAASRMIGWRTVLLTSTKGLQDQYRQDYSEIAYDLRGKGNFRCPIWRELDIPPTTAVSDAPCNYGFRCKHKAGGCEYYDRYREAQRSEVVVTNYQCWLNDRRKEMSRDGTLTKILPIELLVMDEAHDAPEELSRYLETEISQVECERAKVEWPLPGYDMVQWTLWAEHWKGQVAKRVEGYEAMMADGGRLSSGEFRDAARQKGILGKLARVAEIEQDELWIVESSQDGSQVKFSPLWPQRYAEDELFRGAKKIVLVSATVRPKTLDLLDIPEGERNFAEYPSSFPVTRRPVIHVRSVQMRYNMTDDDMQAWLNKIDAIITGRPDRKGVIHTVSYSRAKWLMENSRHRARLVTHGKFDRADKVAWFKRAPVKEGWVLVSPSVDTGYDFAGDECRYQIIAKVPFPDMRSAVQRQRMEVDKEYRNYVTAQTLVQMSGRAVRSEQDWAETFIVDDQFAWFFRQAGEYFSGWFKDAVQWAKMVPPAMQVKEQVKE